MLLRKNVNYIQIEFTAAIEKLKSSAQNNFQNIAKDYFDKFDSNIWEGDYSWDYSNFCKGFKQILNSPLEIEKIILTKKEGLWSAIITFYLGSQKLTRELDTDDFYQLDVINCILLSEINDKINNTIK